MHPVSQVMDELAEIFADMGFAVAEGPEIEDDWHNFTALNIPETHPARAMHDTFYFPDDMARDGQKMVLRTHTSPVQIRTMTSQEPPIRIIAPGRVYRSDSDATHTPMFHQIEGLVIDKGIHLGHLKWTLETFLKSLISNARMSSYVYCGPAISPSPNRRWRLMLAIPSSTANALSVGPKAGWKCWAAGMVHRKVIEACGLDPDMWQGFAFGTGVDRLAMLKYGMDDLRAFFDGDNPLASALWLQCARCPTLSGGVGA